MLSKVTLVCCIFLTIICIVVGLLTTDIAWFTVVSISVVCGALLWGIVRKESL